MRSAPKDSTVFLDFDGVICDSLEECYRSSWLTAAGVAVTSDPLSDPPFDQEYRNRFDACRPFIRSGEDYLVVHEWAAQGRVPTSQGEFDASLSLRGKQALAVMKGQLYQVRESLLQLHRSQWLGWNPLYRGMAEALKQLVANDRVYILSTKKAEFITEILAHHAVHWPKERTLYTGNETKLAIIERHCEDSPSVLIDDQLDHLNFQHSSCDCFLALWGYTTAENAARANATLTLDQALEYFKTIPRNPLPDV